MPRGSHAKGGLRSHRRRIGKHLVIAPWIIITMVSVLVLAGLSTGYVYLVTRGCDGAPVTATVVADPGVYSILQRQAQSWETTDPAVDGHCAKVNVQAKDSASTASVLAPTWDPRTDGPRPDVWVPESTQWMQLAAYRQDAARMLPDKQPSLARSPAVIAMPAPMAKAIGAPKTKLTWHDLATGDKYAGSRWALHGHPEWGAFKFAMSNPTVSTAGLHALTAIADANDNGDITNDERTLLNRLWQIKSDYRPDTDGILQGLTLKDATSSKAALDDVSAFPALEQDVAAYNEASPRVPLAAVYPKDGSTDANFPYLVLKWTSTANHRVDSTAQHQRDDVARAFLKTLRSSAGRKAFLSEGFRDANRRPGTGLTAANGVARTVPTLPRAVMTPDSVSQTVSNWSAISQPSNVLVVMDVSDDMGTEVQGTGKTKLQIAGQAAANAISLFGPQATIGLWAYSSQLDGDKDYQKIVDVGNINDTINGGTRGTAIRDKLPSLYTGGQPGLFNATKAAYQWMRDHYRAGASNQVVVITGTGEDSGDGDGLAGLTSDLSRSQDKDHPLPVVTVGYGSSIDMTALQTIAQSSNGRTYATSSPTEISKVLLTALFSGPPPPQ
ncbi:MAG: substrate-binding and VWA domain-containing protein [Actinocatenispora sp.]